MHSKLKAILAACHIVGTYNDGAADAVMRVVFDGLRPPITGMTHARRTFVGRDWFARTADSLVLTPNAITESQK
jgi:hypothetical protein